jgi:hypothetical protein
VNGQALYAAIWDKSSGPGWVARHGMTSDQYQQQLDTLVSQGYRLEWVSGYPNGASATYAAVWQRDAASTANLVTNPSFETVGPQGPETTCTGVSTEASPSAAAQWLVWNNSNARTSTALVPSTCPNGGSRMIHVLTAGMDNGIYQQWQNGGARASFSVWVFVVHGAVGAGVGNGGRTSITSVTSETGKWVHLTGENAANQPAPINEICVYSSAAGVNEYYVDLVSAS